MAARRLGCRPIVTAVNHWEVAVASHKLNHPDMISLCESIDNLNPRELYRGRKLDLLWGSPECTNHSRARGSKPKNDQSRATAHCITRWTDALRPKTVLVENVVEFMDWAPLDEHGQDILERKGETFVAWLHMLRAMGYTVDMRVLTAADYGDPTIRRRLFVQAQAPGRRIIWPEPTHSKDGVIPGTLPWRTARDIINWDHPMESAFKRKSKGGGPLRTSTMRRIANGLVRYVIDPLIKSGRLDEALKQVANGKQVTQAFLVPQQSGHVSRSLDLPVPTVTANSSGEGLAHAFVVEVNHKDVRGRRVRHLDAPLGTVTAKNGKGLAYVVQIDHTGAKNKSSGARSVDSPMSTVVTKQNAGLVVVDAGPWLIQLRGRSDTRSGCRTLDAPVPTITAGGTHTAICEMVQVQQAEDRFIVRIGQLEIHIGVNFRMFQPDELQLAQGFPAHYQFTGTKTEQVRQIGNAVPCGLAEALVFSAMNQ